MKDKELNEIIDKRVKEREKEILEIIDNEMFVARKFLNGDFNHDKPIKWRLIGFNNLKQKIKEKKE